MALKLVGQTEALPMIFLSFLCQRRGEGITVSHVNTGFSETVGALVEWNLVSSALHYVFSLSPPPLFFSRLNDDMMISSWI